MAIYDTHYQKPDYFGKPYPELVEYVSTLNREKKVVDLGCGQGRDTIAIGRLGFDVTGVDVSSVGIEQMMEVANKEDLHVRGIVADLNQFDQLGDYDLIVLDSMFHFYKNDVKKETSMLERILSQAKQGASIIIIVQKGDFRIKKIKDICQTHLEKCVVIHEESFLYEEFRSEFHMIVCTKEIE